MVKWERSVRSSAGDTPGAFSRHRMEKNAVRKLITIVLFVCAAWATRHAEAQISIGLVSDFQAGTTQDWVSGPFNPNPPTVLLNGHGPGDHALEVVGTGVFGPGGRVVTFNLLQWTGDYLSAGVTAVSMDLNNIGSTDLDIRLAVTGAGGSYSTTASVFLASGSGWTNFVFPVGVSDWTPIGGFNLNATLSAVSQLRILNSPTPAYAAIIEGGDLLVDNITAQGQTCPCACDFDTSTGSGVCDIVDFVTFAGLFAGGDPCACDIDTSTGSGVCDIIDFVTFAGQFAAGCP